MHTLMLGLARATRNTTRRRSSHTRDNNAYYSFYRDTQRKLIYNVKQQSIYFYSAALFDMHCYHLIVELSCKIAISYST